MAKIQGQGMNKEKMIFLACATALAISAYFFLTSRPQELDNAKPITREKSPPQHAIRDTSLREEVDHYLQGKRKSPFTPGNWQKDKPKPKPKPKHVAPPPPPPPPPKSETPKIKDRMGPMAGSDKDLEIEYMGILMTDGKRYALVKPKDGSSPRRVAEGEKLEPWNYTIVRIDRQAIYLKDEEDRPYVLKDGRFGDSGGSVAQITSKSTPKPQPKSTPKDPNPQAQPKNSTPEKKSNRKAAPANTKKNKAQAGRENIDYNKVRKEQNKRREQARIKRDGKDKE